MNDKALFILGNPQHHFSTWLEALFFLCEQCEAHELSFEFGYHSGWFARPHPDDPCMGGERYLDESARGYTIMVGMHSFANDDGTEAFYPKASYAVHDGLRLLRGLLEERDS